MKSEEPTTGAEVAEEQVRDRQSTTCCIVGGGPAGMMLGLLLARQGVAVTVLEAHKDFERDFRGDTVHPSTLEILDDLGLAERVHALPHGKMRALRIITDHGAVTLGDLTRIKTRFPYVLMLPQAQFLDFLCAEARRYPSFQVVLGANVQRLLTEDGVIRGVRFRGSDDAWHEVRADLTVAADGRFSKLRTLAGLVPIKTAPPMDVLWFRLPRESSDRHEEGGLYIHEGHFAVLLERADEWQVGYVILKGDFAEVRSAGMDVLRRTLAKVVPWLGDRVNHLENWKQVAVLSVESSRLPRWHLPGLLLIGDAAHVMSPVGGVGINYAIQDAVEAANLLGGPLLRGEVSERDLAAVQKRREWPVRVIQRIQGIMQARIAAPALQPGKRFWLPFLLRILLRIPFLRNLPGRMLAFGVRRVRVKDAATRR